MTARAWDRLRCRLGGHRPRLVLTDARGRPESLGCTRCLRSWDDPIVLRESPALDTVAMTALAVGVLTAAGRSDIVSVLELEALSRPDLIALVERVALLAAAQPAADVGALPRYLQAWGLAVAARVGGAV